jgi:hypothetical protein
MDIETFSAHVFLHPFTCIIAGPTGCGKTVLLADIIKDSEFLIEKPPERIIYCYSEWQKIFETMQQRGVEFCEGICDIENLDKNQRNLLIFDDLMDECENSLNVKNLFTKGSHHRNISVFMLAQNIFNKGKFSRTLNLNSNYTIFFNNPRDKSQIRYLARETNPEKPKFLVEAYMDAIKYKHGYLFLDNKISTDERLRVQTKITEKYRIVYVPKN